MRCDKIKDLIMDYIDGELSEALRKDIASHLDVCSSCKRMEQSLRSTVIDPLRQAGRVEVPDRVWYQVRDAIVNKKDGLLLPHLIAQWVNYFRIRKPRLVPVATMIAVILFIIVLFFGKTFTTQNMLNVYLEEQANFISQLAKNGEESFFGISDIELGTSIEEYFL